jgi:HK97 family phage portal protein
MAPLTLLNLPAPAIRNVASEGPYMPSDAGLVQALIGITTYTGKTVTRETAMRCVTFLAGVKMLAQDIAKMPLILYERTMVDGRQRTNKALDNPLYPILKDVPNPWMTSYQMRVKLVFDMFFGGGFYCQKLTNVFGEIVQLYPLNPWCMQPRWDRSLKDSKGNVVLRLIFDYDDGNNGKKSFVSTDLWWCSLLNIYGPEGSTIIALAKEALSILMASDEVAGMFFRNGLFANGFITTDPAANIDPTEAQKLTDDVNKFFSSSRNAGKSPLIPYGAKYEKMALTAVEAQLMEGRQWNAKEIIRLLGGNPLCIKLGYGAESSTNASNTVFLEDYFTTSLLPIAVNIEQSITRDLIDPADRATLYAKHNADILLRGSPRERAETNKVLIESGQRMPNETRENDDLDPIDGMDKIILPANSAIYDPEKDELILPSQKNPGDVEVPLDKKLPPAPALPAPNPAKAKLQALADSLAERVLRKAQKAGKADAKFVAEVLGCPLHQAEAYCTGRENGKIKAEDAKAALVALVIGDDHES